MKPPSGGPMTGAISPGQVMVETARTKSFLSTVRNTSRRPTGDIIAAATRALTTTVPGDHNTASDVG